MQHMDVCNHLQASQAFQHGLAPTEASNSKLQIKMHAIQLPIKASTHAVLQELHSNYELSDRRPRSVKSKQAKS